MGMVDSPEVAKRISDLMKDMFERLGECSDVVEAQCSPDEYKAFVHSIRNIASGIVFDVLEPLYERHPSLAPSNWEFERKKSK
jgi:hypothetical protein